MKFGSEFLGFAISLFLTLPWPNVKALSPRVEQVYGRGSSTLSNIDDCPFYATNDGSEMGDGFITNFHLFLVFDAADNDSIFVGVPLVRDELSGKIKDLLFADCFDATGTLTDDFDDADLGFQDGGPNGDRFWSYFDEGFGIGTFDAATNKLNEKYYLDFDSDIAPTLTTGNAEFAATDGVHGISWHPTIQDATLGHNQMYVTFIYGFGRMTWSYNAAANPQYTATGFEYLCKLDRFEYPRGLVFVPSGAQANSVIIADYDNGMFVLSLSADGLCIDAGTGTPTIGTENPSLLPFVDSDVIEYPSGMIIDPATNDFFVTTYGGDSEIIHFSVFVPGVDVQLVVDNISTRVNQITVLANVGGRRSRELGKKKKKKKLTLQDLIDALQAWYNERNPPTTPPSPADITDNVNNAIESGDADAVVEAVVGPLETISTNSLSTAVEQGDFTDFVAEIEGTASAALDAIDTLGEMVAEEDMEEFNTLRAETVTLFDLLIGIPALEEEPEGSG